MSGLCWSSSVLHNNNIFYKGGMHSGALAAIITISTTRDSNVFIIAPRPITMPTRPSRFRLAAWTVSLMACATILPGSAIAPWLSDRPLLGASVAAKSNESVQKDKKDKKDKAGKTSTSKAGHFTQNAEARALGEKILEAFGGFDNYKAFNDRPCRASGQVIQTSGLSGVNNTFDCDLVIKREKEKITITLLGQPLTTVYDGKDCWTQQGNSVLPADGITAKRIEEDIQHGLLLVEAVRNPETRLEVGKPVEIEGKACDTLLIYAPDGIPTSFYADKVNHLVLGSSYPGVDLEQGMRVDKTYHYFDYRDIEGTRQPFKVVEYSGNKKVSETVINKVTVDDSITDAMFTMPKEKLPVRLSAGAVTIPFEYVSNEIMIKAKVNGNVEMKFILDTGATQSILDRTKIKDVLPQLLVDATANGADKNAISMTTGSGSIQATAVNLKTLSLGDMVLNDVPVAVTDLSSFDQLQKDRPAGLIGANILKRFLVTVDYENQRVTFDDPNKSEVPEGAIVVKTKPSLGMSGLAVEGTFDGKQNISFLIDTGAAFNNISETKVKNLVPNPLYKVGMLKGLDGKSVETGSARFDHLDIGKLRLDHPVFSVAPGGVGERTPAGIISATDLAIIGNPLLSRYKVTFDYRNQRLILTQSAAQKALYDYQAKISALRLELVKSKNVNQVVNELKTMVESARSHDLPAAEAILRSELAIALCQKNGGDFSPAYLFRPINAQTLLGEKRVDGDLKPNPNPKQKGDKQARDTDKPVPPINDSSSPAMLEESEGQLLQAYGLAERCRDKTVQARVLGTWGYLYASQNPTLDYLNSAKQKIGKAVSLAPTDADVLASSGYFLSRLESVKAAPRKNIASAAINSIKAEPLRGDYGDGIKYSASAAGMTGKKLQQKSASDATQKDNRKDASHEPIGVVRKGKTVIPIRSLDELGRWLVDQIVDQAIMIDPANWLALLTKLDRVKSQGNNEEAKIIQAQLKHYYPGINISTLLK